MLFSWTVYALFGVKLTGTVKERKRLSPTWQAHLPNGSNLHAASTGSSPCRICFDCATTFSVTKSLHLM
jgi:hypothetical protein